MSDRRRSATQRARRLVIKIGSRALVNRRGGLDKKVFKSIGEDVAALVQGGRSVALVSSGSILAGRVKLELMGKTLTMPEKQAAASVGQHILMNEWARALARHGVRTGQVLLTADDLKDRTRFLNSRNTMEELFSMGVLPVINENDTVAVEEIRYGDNDHIATLIAGQLHAELLVILTDIDGLLAEDPRVNPQAPLVREVMESECKLFANAGPSHSGVGSGGMATKIEAARTAARLGMHTVIANAKTPAVVSRIMSGERLGTLFVPESKPMAERKYWMAFAGGPRGTLTVDGGAARALTSRGKSLLPSGLTRVEGRFDKGDLVRVVDESGREVARGLTYYGSSDLKKIAGVKTSEIESVLGQMLYEEVVHRDYMVLTSDD